MLMQTLCSVAPRRRRVYRLPSRLAADRHEIYQIEGGLICPNLHGSAAIGEYLAPFRFTYFPDCDELATTRDIPAAAFEVAAVRLQS